MLKVDMEYDRKILFVRLKGQLNKKVSYKINNYLNPVILKHQIKNIVINFDEIKSIDESGVNAILNTKCTVKRCKGNLYLCGLNKEVSLNLKKLHIKKVSSELAALKMIEV